MFLLGYLEYTRSLLFTWICLIFDNVNENYSFVNVNDNYSFVIMN